jgi:pSer/pThr/pTyr-binding forkhead associated (FHA) protein/DNA-directed RNA polymerase subunit RPC12/RpoP
MSTPNRCARCGRENEAKFAFCLDCGQPLAAEKPGEVTCPSCGAPVQAGFRFCGICGKPVAGSAAPTPRHGAIPTVPPMPAVAPPAPRATRIRLALVRSDGVPGQILAVEKDEALCGRTEGDLLLPDDTTISPRHARFTVMGGVLRVEDLGSVNGTFVRLKEGRALAVGDEFRVGRQLLRLEPLPRPPRAEDPAGTRTWGTKDPGYRLRLSQLLEGGGLGEVFPLREGENLLGREAGEVTFPGDRYVSARHARLDVTADGVRLTDTGSSNGTYVKIAGAMELSIGDQLLVGAQLLRVE